MTSSGSDGLVTLPDGRVVATCEVGDPAGFAVLFHAGSPGGRFQALGYDRQARAAGVRLVAVNRPGYGDSTLTPPSLATVGQDGLAVADAVGFGDFSVLGVSGGGPYALATGLADPARVRRVGVGAGIGPWRLVDRGPEDNPELAALALADAGDVAGAVAAMRTLCEEERGGLLDLDDEAMVDAFFAGLSPGELTWLTQDARVAWARDMRDAWRTMDGYARDNVSWGAAWDIDVSALRVPTRLWYGERDRLVPPSHGRWLADRIPGAVLDVRAALGHGEVCTGLADEMLAWVASPR